MENTEPNERLIVEIAGECEAWLDGERWMGRFEFGFIEYRNGQGFDNVYSKIVGPDGSEWIGRSRWSPAVAARASFQKLAESGLRLEADDIGVDWEFFCSKTGGYIRAAGKSTL